MRQSLAQVGYIGMRMFYNLVQKCDWISAAHVIDVMDTLKVVCAGYLYNANAYCYPPSGKYCLRSACICLSVAIKKKINSVW